MKSYRHSEVDGVAVVHRSDVKNSISSWLGLTTHGGNLAAVVESDKAKDQITALLDLLDLRLNGQGSGTSSVVLMLHGPHPEAVAALEVLRSSVEHEVEVQLLQCDCNSSPGGSTWAPIPPSDFDAGDAARFYPRWPGLLDADFTPPSLLQDLISRVRLRELRAYPQLTDNGAWSIRLEGLQVGRIHRTNTGFLNVGEDREERRGPERTTWLDVHAAGRFEIDQTNVADAAEHIAKFAGAWRNVRGGTQNEHVLESRILRGAVPVIIDGKQMRLIREDASINWGSQFPTKWGPGRQARYLDALLRDPADPAVPWAIEMKVRLSEGQYYRHAVAQAVLYRHFIRDAKPLHFWFQDNYGLDPTRCRAAVVVPTFKTPAWETRLRALCKLFDVELAIVPEAATRR